MPVTAHIDGAMGGCFGTAKVDPVAACGSLSQSCQWLSPVTRTKLTEVHF